MPITVCKHIIIIKEIGTRNFYTLNIIYEYT